MKKYSNALLLGYGRSGQAAERLLQSEGTETRVITRESADDEELVRTLADHRFDVCVVSPGFGLEHPWLCAVRDAGIPLLSELELGWSRHRGKTVAITGSNGKSTAVKWTCEILQEAGYRAAIGGNYGIPACETVLKNPGLEWLVLEVSSFQLETTVDFRADIAVVLNILPNHLDRHGDMETYWRTKARVFGVSSHPEDACLVPVQWLDRFQSVAGADRQWITFGDSDDADFRFSEGMVLHGSQAVLDLSDTLFDSPVIGSCTGTSVAAVTALVGVPLEVVGRVARRFVPLPHRMEKLGTLNGVDYVNDSKATNLAALSAALRACGKGVHLIAGGLPKESDYTFVKEILAERVRRIYLVGQASRAMYQAWNELCACVECGTLEEAFRSAKTAAIQGDTILLSPGCASFDQFCSFEERGERFRALFQDAMHSGSDAV